MRLLPIFPVFLQLKCQILTCKLLSNMVFTEFTEFTEAVNETTLTA